MSRNASLRKVRALMVMLIIVTATNFGISVTQDIGGEKSVIPQPKPPIPKSVIPQPKPPIPKSVIPQPKPPIP